PPWSRRGSRCDGKALPGADRAARPPGRGRCGWQAGCGAWTKSSLRDGAGCKAISSAYVTQFWKDHPMADVELSAVPTPLSWAGTSVAGSSDDVAALRIEAGPGTDLFVDPAGAEPSLNAPRLLTSLPDGDFQLSARVTVPFASGFDAGVLLLWANE